MTNYKIIKLNLKDANSREGANCARELGGGTVEAEKEGREVLTEKFKEERNASSNARLREGRGGVL